MPTQHNSHKKEEEWAEIKEGIVPTEDANEGHLRNQYEQGAQAVYIDVHHNFSTSMLAVSLPKANPDNIEYIDEYKIKE